MKEIPRNEQLAVPPYYQVLWHNCHNCKTHYTSDAPHVRAYLCDECWKSIPHYKTKAVIRIKKKKGIENWLQEMDNTMFGAMLYILGCSICLLIVGYYLWWK